MKELTKRDLSLCVSRLPKDVRELIRAHNLFVAGGFIRSTISGERVSDIDLFGPSKDVLELAAYKLQSGRGGRIHTTKNASTVLTKGYRIPAQFIFRWVYATAKELCLDFDFTMCQAVIGCDANGKWYSVCGDDFYADLAAHRLVYTFPNREEEAGGSLLRVRKFLKRGYNIQAYSLAGVIARLVGKLERSKMAEGTEEDLTKVLSGLLREVDHLVIVDGVDALDEHEIMEQEGVA